MDGAVFSNSGFGAFTASLTRVSVSLVDLCPGDSISVLFGPLGPGSQKPAQIFLLQSAGIGGGWWWGDADCSPPGPAFNELAHKVDEKPQQIPFDLQFASLLPRILALTFCAVISFLISIDAQPQRLCYC